MSADIATGFQIDFLTDFALLGSKYVVCHKFELRSYKDTIRAAAACNDLHGTLTAVNTEKIDLNSLGLDVSRFFD